MKRSAMAGLSVLKNQKSGFQFTKIVKAGRKPVQPDVEVAAKQTMSAKNCLSQRMHNVTKKARLFQ